MQIGIISYSLYLIHVPVIDLIWVGIDRVMVGKFEFREECHRLSIFAIPASIALAYVFYVLFESPFLRNHVKASSIKSKTPSSGENQPAEEGEKKSNPSAR